MTTLLQLTDGVRRLVSTLYKDTQYVTSRFHYHTFQDENGTHFVGVDDIYIKIGNREYCISIKDDYLQSHSFTDCLNKAFEGFKNEYEKHAK